MNQIESLRNPTTLLELTHHNLGWPSPKEIHNPSGEGSRVFSEWAKSKILSALSQLENNTRIEIGILSRNSLTHSTETPLAIVVEFKNTASEETLKELHRLAWNFSHSPTVMTIEPELLRVWTCCEPPTLHKNINEYEVARLSKSDLSSSQIDLQTRILETFHWINFISGQFFSQTPERFRRDQRADQLLLANLRYLRTALHELDLKDDDVCHDLLARVIFVQFLFQRKDSKGRAALNQDMLKSLHKDGILSKEHDSFSSILEDYNEVYRFFDWLNAKFNGDLFPGKGSNAKERALGWQREKQLVKSEHLKLIRDFINGNVKMHTGQLCLWPQYAFDVIPLEFISSIYETFVSEKAHKEGIYYTPQHLVDFILDRVLPWNGAEWDQKVIDPACGSGVFLVKAYQRLIHRWKRANPERTPNASLLRSLLEKNIFGVDKDPHAVRVAAFSLYLAMCDEIDPKYYWTQVVFPAMRGKRIICSDFFEENQSGFCTEIDSGKYDLVIGNAPWGKNLLTDTAKNWAESDNHQWPIVNKDIGTLFLPKAAMLAKPSGCIAMIQPAGSLLFNKSGPARSFRKKLFYSFCVEEVINLSVLRFKIFNRKAHSLDTSISPPCVIILRPGTYKDKIVYTSPKSIEVSVDEFDFVVEPQDIKKIDVWDAAEDPNVWTALMWGGPRDRVLLNRLASLPTIRNPGKYFQVKTREGIISGDRKSRRPSLVGRPILREKDFSQNNVLYIDAKGLPINQDETTDSRASTDFSAFSFPQLIIKQSWKAAISRFQARLVSDVKESGILCSQSYISVNTPVPQRALLEAACLSYNSKFAVYYLLLTSGRFASYRPEPLVDELLRVPIPEPRKDLLKNVSNYSEIDLRLKESLGLKDAEWTLIEDLFDITLSDFKGGLNSPGRKRTIRNSITENKQEPHLSQYCDFFIKVLKSGFGLDKNISATIYQEPNGKTYPYRLVAFNLHARNDKLEIRSLDSKSLIRELEKFNDFWITKTSDSDATVFHRRVARLYRYVDGKPLIFILKPDAVRYWTRSAGLFDADEVAKDFVTWQAKSDVNTI